MPLSLVTGDFGINTANCSELLVANVPCKVCDTTTATSLHFHQRCGGNVVMKEGGMVVERTDADGGDGAAS